MFKRNEAWDSLPMSKSDHKKKWDADARLIQPFGAEQALIYDYAECVAARTFLLMSNLPHTVEGRQNAEYISPTRELPVLLSHGSLVSGFESIVRFAVEQGFVSLEVTDQEMGEMEGLVSLVQEVLVNAELYICWVVKPVLRKVTIPRFSCFYSWPLNHILPWARMKVIRGNLGASDWLDKSLDQVLLEMKLCCRVLSLHLQEKPYLMGKRPTPLDALVFGHLFTLITTDLPTVNLGAIVKQFPNLERLCLQIDQTYFKGPTQIED
ncbi:metaxin 2 [Trichuris trichiura]|uniref:Metaxin 2 n=1 Tax=Trichuris trichiura TaxID=36087 RepID=A0A077ZA10_TRITR|nr:metaxin 2 [Trichuris trichiura]